VTDLSTFLEYSLNFLSSNLKKYTIWYNQGEKRCQSLHCQKHSLKGESGTKSPVKPSWIEKMTVLNMFFKSSLNFLSNNLKNKTKFVTVREKSGVRICIARNAVFVIYQSNFPGRVKYLLLFNSLITSFNQK